MNRYGFVILAAGSSSRLGKPKQLLPWKGKSLLERSIDAALNTNKGPVIVVLGSNADLIHKTLADYEVDIVINASWIDGMASSIQCGLTALVNRHPEVNNVMIMLSDQPFVSTDLLHQLIILQEQTGKSIVTCSYNNTPGVPALFAKKIFTALMELKGQEGAKKIILNHPSELSIVAFEAGKIDIDTAEDYDALLKK